MLSPTILKKAGVPYEIVIQRPGDAIVTSPGAYHFGVNLGFNIAEATNFGIPEWIPKGREAKVCMCRPNAVRIDVDRFAELLARYEEDMENSRALGLQPLSHRQWTVFQAKRIQATNVSSSSVPKSSKTVIPKDKEFWVEVMQPLNAEGKSLAVSRSRGNKRRKKNSLDTEFVEEWRLAKPLDNKKTKLQLEQKVLCLLPGRKEGIDGEVVDEEECFAGVVKEFADDHCRVHFSGLKKDDDVWIALTDPKLFLDGGKWDATAVLEEKPEASRPSSLKRKDSKRKLALVKPLSAKATKSASKIRSKKQAANAI
jgi:jumonji domain-containing protein 2